MKVNIQFLPIEKKSAGISVPIEKKVQAYLFLSKKECRPICSASEKECRPVCSVPKMMQANLDPTYTGDSDLQHFGGGIFQYFCLVILIFFLFLNLFKFYLIFIRSFF